MKRSKKVIETIKQFIKNRNDAWKVFMLEAELQVVVLKYLSEEPGYFSWRNYVGPIVRAKKRFSPNPMAGFPDIFGFNVQNKPFAIELKSQAGRVSDKQKMWLKNLEDKGVYCIVAKDLATVISELQILASQSFSL